MAEADRHQGGPDEAAGEAFSSAGDAVSARAKKIWRAVLNAFGRFMLQSRFASLTRRIIVFNVVGLCLLVAGILYLNQFRQGLIDARKQSLMTQAQIIAGAIGETATAAPPTRTIDPLEQMAERGRWVNPDDYFAERDIPIIAEEAAPILRRLILPTQTRARLYDKDGWLILDSRQLTDAGQIILFELPPVDGTDDLGFFTRIWDDLREYLPVRNLPRYREAGSQNGYIYDEVSRALTGDLATMERISERGELIVSVAVPVQRFRAVQGALMLSTEGGDIDAIVRAERVAIVQVFLVALAVSVLLSVVLAGTIAEPVRRLAEAAERVRKGKSSRVEIPDFTARRDEIGELSGSLRDMTKALYDRIDAIESFAADVAHELKNPLTSIRSAIETLDVAKTPEQRTRLMDIIQHDIRRIDRLISDISDASRLDAELSRQELDDVRLDTLAEAVVSLFNETGTDGARSVIFDMPVGARSDTAFCVKGGADRLGQVLRNLIDNALSFTPENGHVYLRLTRGAQMVRLAVEDEGPGVPEASLERIFERFHSDRPGAFGRHSGLGLSISKQIVEAHGGRIWAENRKEGGARFIVELPVAEA